MAIKLDNWLGEIVEQLDPLANSNESIVFPHPFVDPTTKPPESFFVGDLEIDDFVDAVAKVIGLLGGAREAV